MTKRTTDEWQTLLDGTTPGPWGHYVPRGADGHYDPVFGDVPGDEVSLVKRPADWHLIAAAPEAVAEVVRLHRELEELRDCYRHREARSRERLESVTDEREQSHLARFEHMHRRTHEALTRILEGGSND